MSSIKDYALQNWHQTCIDDIITQYDSLSLSSSETDNITLDSGIYFDSKSDLLKQSTPSNVPPIEQPPPPPPYNSNHNIISSVLETTNLQKPFHSENISNLFPNNNSNSDLCSNTDSSLNSHSQNQSTLSDNRFVSSRLSSENRKQCDAVFEVCYTNKLTESPNYQEHKTNQESFTIEHLNPPKPSQSDGMYLNSQLFHNLSKQMHSGLRNEPLFDPKYVDDQKQDIKILGACNKCQRLITDSESACIALGNLYHSNCFICCHCSRSLRGKVFYKDQEKIYCENDYMVFGFHKSVKICNACGHIITETILEALGKDFHPRCFKCSICLKCLDGIPFTVDRNNNIYCILDYHNTFAPRCAICLQPIIPRKDSDDVVRVVVNDRDFHVECYRCQICLRLLSNESNCFVWTTDRSEVNIKLLCRKCYVSQFQELSRLKQL